MCDKTEDNKVGCGEPILVAKVKETESTDAKKKVPMAGNGISGISAISVQLVESTICCSFNVGVRLQDGSIKEFVVTGEANADTILEAIKSSTGMTDSGLEAMLQEILKNKMESNEDEVRGGFMLTLSTGRTLGIIENGIGLEVITEYGGKAIVSTLRNISKHYHKEARTLYEKLIHPKYPNTRALRREMISLIRKAKTKGHVFGVLGVFVKIAFDGREVVNQARLGRYDRAFYKATLIALDIGAYYAISAAVASGMMLSPATGPVLIAVGFIAIVLFSVALDKLYSSGSERLDDWRQKFLDGLNTLSTYEFWAGPWKYLPRR